MPRTKGSKNRPKSDIVSQIVEKQTIVTTLTIEIEAIQKEINDLKATLKEKRSELKSSEKEVAKLEAADQKAAEEAKKLEAEAVVKKLLAGGMSADEILEKLK